MALKELLTAEFSGVSDSDVVQQLNAVTTVRVVRTEIGKGRILETLGLSAGNALLDVIDNAPDFRHVKHLVANGWLDVGSALVRASVDALVPDVLTQEQADALKALAEQPCSRADLMGITVRESDVYNARQEA